MIPAARISAAVEVLDEYLNGTPVERALTGWARRSRFAGSKDRAAIRDHVYDALRCRRSYAAFGGGLTGRGLMIGQMIAQGHDPDDIFTGIGYAPTQISTAERAAFSSPTENDLLDLPDWGIEELKTHQPDQLHNIAIALKSRAPVMLRVNLMKSDVDQALECLQKQDVIAQTCERATTALIVTDGARKIQNSDAYQNGLVDLQDGSSQAVIEALNIQPGMRVLDYCAGGGGKALAMAALGADVTAHDINPARMKDVPNRATRAGVKITQATHDQISGMAPFDLVLCDVPCSGSGSWRRDPQGKWDLSIEKFQQVLNVQMQIVLEAVKYLKKGGTFAYATCSVMKAENEWAIETITSQYTEIDEVEKHQWFPDEEGDGFFVARFNV